jgi:aspartate kinase
VDMIVEAQNQQGGSDKSFTVSRQELKRTQQALSEILENLGAGGVKFEEGFAKVSVVGIGMRGHPGVAAEVFEALASNNVNIEMISTSEIRISCLVKEEAAETAVRALHDKFELGVAVEDDPSA